MAGTAQPNSPDGHYAPPVKVRQLQNRLWAAAKQSEGRRFHALYDRIYRSDVLWEAWERVRANRGAAGVDGTDPRGSGGLWGGAYARRAPRGPPCRQSTTRHPCAGWRFQSLTARKRPLGIPTIADRVCPTGGEDRPRTYFRGRFSCPARSGFDPSVRPPRPWRSIRVGFLRGQAVCL